MTTKKPPQQVRPPLLINLPAGMADKRLRDLTLEEQLWLTMRLLAAGATLAAISAARRAVDALKP